jgi:hypothetical protein
MKWTTDKPKVPGWYWYKHSTKAIIVVVDDLLCVQDTDENTDHVDEISGQWAGPLEAPQ